MEISPHGFEFGPEWGQNCWQFFAGRRALGCRDGTKMCLTTVLVGECIFLLVSWQGFKVLG